MKNPLWSNIFKKKKPTDSHIQLTLKQVPVFDGLSTRNLTAIEDIVHERHFVKDEIIFKESTPGLGMYIILKGNVSITGVTSDNKSVEYAKLGQGDFFGEVSLIDESDRSATAIAGSDCHLMAFFKVELMDILTHSPKLGNKILLNLARVISTRLKTTNLALQKKSEIKD